LIFRQHHFDSGKVQPIFSKGARNEPPALVIADQPEPTGFGSQSRNLREIVSRNAAGVNFQALVLIFSSGPSKRERSRSNRYRSFRFRRQ